MPAGGLGDVTRGDLDQSRSGVPDQPGEPYPGHPETSSSEPALANDHVLRDESAAGDGTDGDGTDGYRCPSSTNASVISQRTRGDRDGATSC